MSLPVTSRAAFDEARRLWQEAADAGRLDEARDLLAAAWPWVEAEGDTTLRDRVLCNRAAIAIELGEECAFVDQLRQLLLRSADKANARLAAYTLSRAYELRGDGKKALFYARLALVGAEALGEAEWIASSRNQVANLLVAEGRFGDAIATYTEALGALADDGTLRAAIATYNRGYCRVVSGQMDAGLADLYRGLRALVRLGSTRHEALARLDLAFCLVDRGRPRLARRHAGRALLLARRLGDFKAVKNALFILGSAAQLAGDDVSARFHFRQLAADFYPDADYLPELLASSDLRLLVNLKG